MQSLEQYNQNFVVFYSTFDCCISNKSYVNFKMSFTFQFLQDPFDNSTILIMGLPCLNICLLLLLLSLLQQAEHGFNTMTSFSRLQGNTFLSIQWNIQCTLGLKGSQELNTSSCEEYVFPSRHGLHSFFISLSLILVPHWETKLIHLDMYDISNKLTCLHQIQPSTYCICMLQLQPGKIEKGIQLMWFALLPLNSFTLSITKNIL